MVTTQVSQLEERLHEEQTHAQKKESEVASLRTQVATLSAQLAHAQTRSSGHLPTSHKVRITLSQELLRFNSFCSDFHTNPFHFVIKFSYFILVLENILCIFYPVSQLLLFLVVALEFYMI